MKIWLARHGQTDFNKTHLMQGHTDKPLNETGMEQARAMRKKILAAHPDLHFDAVYASPLNRAQVTGSLLSDVPEDQLIIDDRLIEVDFGKYELKPYGSMGFAMTLYWLLPEIIPAPRTVEPVRSMVERSSSFLSELEKKDYDNVLVACHGGILRALFGYMEDRKNGIRWRPKPKNCEIRVYESVNETHRFLEDYHMDEIK